ncbi:MULTISPECIES: transcription/translation regulatory transformer protein RfaH [Vibrio]|jgi:transcriptional antiterminator RfaH|uniref:Transcription antitermination protein RfaH n=1 Tax=Vibrio mediterranei TaxID=689 RepID=A0AAJ3QK61_9VIBR|nr:MULTISPECIES: transcription/translation regulatory transformer protein RfaH [Vibrio]ASI88789.1 transcriptional activator RfaH [Vibrio mediterranei]KFA96373.1 transcriptional regulator [Vibrio sp. ER1A]MCG9626804.1 transcription/translation regulatory transformer protein RfaH [Vibrio mediterranei]MCG9660464.1 transcription/translation regulatory transformer protein RfaH [Vibrio mediterranei]MCG9662446.1 transcription/translation regulatory transformer protein RfaH [Vibrio mediterranei]
MKRWYLLYCKRGEQARAKMHLENQGLECYYPEISVEKILRGKRQNVKEPLFPSYVFVKFDYEVGPSFTTVRSTRGVVDFIRFGAHPKEINGDLIFELRSIVHCDEPDCADLPDKGECVRVIGGQFAGIEAIFQEADGEARSIMLVNLINKQVPVSIDNKDLDI